MKLKKISYLLLIVGTWCLSITGVSAATKLTKETFTSIMEEKGYTISDYSNSYYTEIYAYNSSSSNYDYSYNRFAFIIYDNQEDAIDAMIEEYEDFDDSYYYGDEITSSSNITENTNTETSSLTATVTESGTKYYLSAYRIGNTIVSGVCTSKATLDSVMDDLGYSDNANSKINSKNSALITLVVIVAIIVVGYVLYRKGLIQTKVTFPKGSTDGFDEEDEEETEDTKGKEATKKEEYVFCGECGAKNKASLKFCTKCGFPLENDEKN